MFLTLLVSKISRYKIVQLIEGVALMALVWTLGYTWSLSQCTAVQWRNCFIEPEVEVFQQQHWGELWFQNFTIATGGGCCPPGPIWPESLLSKLCDTCDTYVCQNKYSCGQYVSYFWPPFQVIGWLCYLVSLSNNLRSFFWEEEKSRWQLWDISDRVEPQKKKRKIE